MSKNSAQEEELLVLSSIYPKEFKQIPNSQFYEVEIPLSGCTKELQLTLSLKWCLSPEYPDESPPTFNLYSQDDWKWLTDSRISLLSNELNEVYKQNTSVIILCWVEWLRENTIPSLGLKGDMARKVDEIKIQRDKQQKEQELQEALQNEPQQQIPVKNTSNSFPKQASKILLDIKHGEPITDRKSKFQAHFAQVHSLEEVDFFINKLKENKKIAEATHNIVAYRIQKEKSLEENRDDDGETGAGDKVLYTLQKLNAINVVIMVTRWYGGIQLGNDRFKHIVNVAKELVVQHFPKSENKQNKS